MEVEQILHMNGGEGENSYANNSLTQKEAIVKAKPLLEQSLNDLYCNGFPDCITVADMGCSSGPNALLPTWEAIDSLDKICNRLNRKPPVLHSFLNDLPGSDFNTVFKSLPSFYERLRTEKGHEFGSCFMPKEPMSEFDIHRAYFDQFKSDFSAFLKFRSEELKCGGRMILTLLYNDSFHATSPGEPALLVIKDMISEGLIEESKLKSSNFPIYAPYVDEVKQVIEREGSFDIHQLETFHVSWLEGFVENDNEGLDKYARGKYVTRHVRAVGESLLSSICGDDAIVEEIYRRFAIKVTDEILEKGRGAFANLLISLVKKL
ncbi:Jasmonate O-methyltransferase [Citrus sinensis]|uniref:Jasmonate O-methyltransferase n=1 Tax=Citrus sinensis TaxID=2711 RepID=A0ACB8N7B6_CITSI|nr:Jasmonate O-methyltransferase [Citrus sinensis]